MPNIELQSVLDTTQIVVILQVIAALGSCIAAFVSLSLVIKTNNIQTNSFTTDYCNNVLNSSISNILSINSTQLYKALNSYSLFTTKKMNDYSKKIYFEAKMDMLEIEAMMTLISKNDLLNKELVRDFFTASFEKVVARKIYYYIVTSKSDYHLYTKNITDNNFSYKYCEKLIFNENLFNLSDECFETIYDIEMGEFINYYEDIRMTSDKFYVIFKLFFEARSTFDIESYSNIENLVNLITSKMDRNYVDKLVNEVLIDMSEGTYKYASYAYTTTNSFKKFTKKIIKLLKNTSNEYLENNSSSKESMTNFNDIPVLDANKYIEMFSFYLSEGDLHLPKDIIDDITDILTSGDPDEIKHISSKYRNEFPNPIWDELIEIANDDENSI